MGYFSNITTKIRKAFSSGDSYNSVGGAAAAKNLTSDLVNFLIDHSDFQNEIPEIVYEELYKWEPEIGGAIDKISTMVGQAYKYFITRNEAYLPENVEGNEDLAGDMVKEANQIADEINVRNAFEIYMEILMMQGNLYLENHPDLSQTIIPNRQVTLLDSLEHRAGLTDPDQVMSVANVMIINEGKMNERILINTPKHKAFVVQKFKDTPVFLRDNCGRLTFGLYAISPLQRAVLPIWQKRQITIIDILWRWRNVPREHHKLNAEMFSLDKYTGDPKTRLANSRTDANTYLSDYVSMIKGQMPDQGLVTLDTVNVDYVQPQNSQYMEGNALLDQINDQIWSALNVPKSIVTGQSKNSYASELIISNYTSTKIVQLATKVKKVVLDNMKERLVMLNAEYPIELLDIKIDFTMANSILETYRQAAIMASISDTFTRSEMRELTGRPPLTDEQKGDLYSNIPDIPTTGADLTKTGKNLQQQRVGKTAAYPDTPNNSLTHGTDVGKYAYEKNEQQNM